MLDIIPKEDMTEEQERKMIKNVDLSSVHVN